ALTLLGALFGGAGFVWGLSKLIKKLQGKEPKRVIEAGPNVTIVTEEDEELCVDSRVFKLYRKRTVRRAMADFSRPLVRDAIDEIKVSSEGVTLDVIDKADGPSFQEIPPEEEPPTETLQTEGLFAIVAPVFKPGNKWRLS